MRVCRAVLRLTDKHIKISVFLFLIYAGETAYIYIYIYIVTSVPSPYQRCPGNTRGAPVHSSSRADRPHLRLVSLPALKQHAHGDKARSLSMRQKPNSLSFSRSRQQCMTDQHHHEHRTDSPAPGYDSEHCHKPTRHHHPRP